MRKKLHSIARTVINIYPFSKTNRHTVSTPVSAPPRFPFYEYMGYISSITGILSFIIYNVNQSHLNTKELIETTQKNTLKNIKDANTIHYHETKQMVENLIKQKNKEYNDDTPWYKRITTKPPTYIINSDTLFPPPKPN